MKSILHIATISSNSDGMVNQLSIEDDYDSKEWSTLLITSNKRYKKENFTNVCNTTWLLRPLEVYCRYFIQFTHIIAALRKYKFILVRYTICNPFLWVACLLSKKIITIHHTFEYEELGGKLGVLDKFFRKKILSKTKKAIGVTREIANYESSQVSCQQDNFLTFVYHNGIDYGRTTAAKDFREDHCFNLCFIASDCDAPWHGLQEIVDFLDAFPGDIRLHIVGESKYKFNHEFVMQYGSKSFDFIHNEILPICHAALAGQKLSRNSMTTATTLKVREYLAAGIPVISGHIDDALPDDFPYYANIGLVDINSWSKTLDLFSNVSRSQVRSASSKYIDKHEIMRQLIKDLLANDGV